jgi:hypothetical protein
MSYAVSNPVFLAGSVANSATFTVGYPTGTTQATFTNGLAGTAHVLILNDNEVITGASNFTVSFGASEITVTNVAMGTLAAGTKIVAQFDRNPGVDGLARPYATPQDGNDVLHLVFPIRLAAITGNVDVVTDFRPGIRGQIEWLQWVQDVPVSTAGRTATLQLEVGSTATTGGLVTITSALATPLGRVIAGTAITAGGAITEESAISVLGTIGGGTAHAEGTGSLHVRIRKT